MLSITQYYNLSTREQGSFSFSILKTTQLQAKRDCCNRNRFVILVHINLPVQLPISSNSECFYDMP